MEYFSKTDWNLQNTVIFLDVDGTLVGEGRSKLDKKTLEKFSSLQKNNTIILCSNSPKKARTQKMAEELGVDWMKGPHKKPNKQVLDDLDFSPKQKKVVIGNLFCIDGRFAKNIGATFLPVKTLVAPSENWLNKLFYLVDRFLFSLWI